MFMRVLSFFLLLACALGATGQRLQVSEPEFAGTVVYVNDSIGEGVKLEQQVPVTKTKSNGAMFIPVVGFAADKNKTKSVVKGASSPVVIPNTRRVQFIVRSVNNAMDPITMITLFRLNKEKEQRTVLQSSASLLGGYQEADLDRVLFSGKRYGSASYLLTVDGLTPGEYAFTVDGLSTVFHLFSVQ